MEIRQARIKAHLIINGEESYSNHVRDSIISSLKKVPNHAKPLIIEKDKELLLKFKKKTCLARVYEYQNWYKDRWGGWETDFQCLIFLEGEMYIREARAPAHKELIIKEFGKLTWVGITIIKDKSKIKKDISLEIMAKFYSDDFKLLMKVNNE